MTNHTTSSHPLSPEGILKHRLLDRMTAFTPLGVLALFLAGVLVLHPEIGLAMLRFLPLQVVPMGSESSLMYLTLTGVPTLLVFAFLCIVDLATSFPFFVLTETLQKVPLVGGYVTRMETGGVAFFERHEWLKRLGPLGLLLFVAVPLSGTGTTMGILAGRVMGLSLRTSAAAVISGTILRWLSVIGVVSAVQALF